MILSVIVSFALVSVVSSVKLCGSPKIDSITYNPSTRMWFLTSQGSYWYVKDPLPTDQSGSALPEGFKTGDAAAFYDQQSGCGQTGDQIVLMVEFKDGVNEVIEFNTNSQEWKGKRPWSDHPYVGRAMIDVTKKIDAMFSIGTIIFVVQGKDYAAVDWSPLCKDKTSSLKTFPKRNSDSDMSYSADTPMDAAVYKNNSIFIFKDQKFYILNINPSFAKKGQISGSRSTTFPNNDIGTEFLKVEKCTGEQPKGGDNTNNDDNQSDDNEKPEKEGAKSGGEDDGDSDGGVSGVLIGMGIVILLVVVVVIGLLVFAVTKNSRKPQEKSGKKPAVGPKSKAGQSANAAKLSKASKK